MNRRSSRPFEPTGFLALCLFGSFVLGISRFSGAPVIDFCADDWRIVEIARQYPHFVDTWTVLPRWPDRPLGTVALVYGFSRIGEQLSGYAVLGFFLGFLFMLFTSLMAYELTGSRFCAFLAGLVFASLPTLTETFQWPTMVMYGLGFAAYPAAGWAALRWIRRRRIEWLIVSACLFAFALGTYEVGIGLPVVFIALWRQAPRRAVISAVLAWGLMSMVYLSWKFTGAFGLSHDLLFPTRSVDWNEIPWRWNALEAARWWMGGHFANAVREGWNGFADLPAGRQRILFAVNFLLVALTILVARKLHNAESKSAFATPFTNAAIIAFAGLWFLFGQVLNLVSWSGPRLALVPTAGFAILVSWFLRKIDYRAWSPVAAVVLVISLIANQGTSRQWQENSRFQRSLFNTLQASKPDWSEMDVIVFDTTRLRQKRAPGLSEEVSGDPRLWAYYGNTVFLRGFVVRSMLNLISDRPPIAIFDTEHVIEWSPDRVRWSDWYESNLKYEAPRERVHIIDVLAAGSSATQNSR